MKKSQKLLLIALLALFVVTLFTAVACEPTEFTVTFVADGVTVDTQTFTKENKNITQPQVPTKTGYTGVWEEYTLGDKNLTVNAIYTPHTTLVTLDYDGADGNMGVTELTLTYDQTVGTLPSPTKTGYEFINWMYNSSSVSQAEIWKHDVEEATFVALWRKIIVPELTYENYQDGLQVTGFTIRTVTEIVVPETYEGKTVLAIGQYAFNGYDKLTSVTLPSSIQYISSYAFLNCSSLTTINIPYGVTSILGSTFKGCSSLDNVTLPTSVTRIYNNAFDGCTSLSNITLSDELTLIDLFAFHGCAGLTSITIPNKVFYIGDSAFRGTGLTSISIPQSVTQLHRNAFADCENLASVTFEATDGWFYTTEFSGTSGTEIDASDLADPTTAAQYLTDTYCKYYWKRNVAEE
ncbi:MAG: leucine-rich repeat protein [Clostridiales bacterium]|nr:leucine-rich repeat protein [Clostridiales bacterium]